MSFRKLQRTATSKRSIAESTRPLVYLDSELHTPEQWTRHPCWLTLPTIDETDEKFVGLHAVSPDSSFVALLVNLDVAGTYTVDWGDGNIETFTNNTQAEHQYDFNNAALDGTNCPITIQASTDTITRSNHGFENGRRIVIADVGAATGIYNLTPYFVVNATTNTFQVSESRGGSPIDITADGTGNLLLYKQAVIVVTPESGKEMRLLTLTRRHSSVSGLTYSADWLDIALSMPNATSITLSNASAVPRFNYLELAKLYNLGNITSMADMLFGCNSLAAVPVLNIPSTCTSLSRLFASCYRLRELPATLDTTNVTNFQQMFDYCYKLASVPEFTTSKGTNLSYLFRFNYLLVRPPEGLDFANTTTCLATFQNCYSLRQIAPVFAPNSTTFNLFLAGCTVLKDVPYIDSSSSTNFASMFNGCYSLQRTISVNTSKGTNLASMYNHCNTLNRIPWFDTSVATDINTMFYRNVSIQQIPKLDVANVTTTASTFYECRSLKTVPEFNFGVGKLTNTSNMFRDCDSLISVPLFDTSNVTNMSLMFYACNVLQEVPLFDTNKVTTMAQMLQVCPNLIAIPTFNTANVTSFSGAFGSCSTLRDVPNLDFSSATTVDSMFSADFCLQYLPKFNFVNATTVSNVFNACFSLQRVPSFIINGTNNTVYRILYNCISLCEIPNINFANSATITEAFFASYGMRSSRATGLSKSFNITNAHFSANALNALYTSLPSVSGQTITVTTNWGTASDNTSIATSKGWTVTG